MFLFHIRDIRVIRRRMRCLLFFLGFVAQAFSAGLQSYSHLVVSDSGAARDAVRVTYLGTNGYQFEFRGHALLVDPYFSSRGPVESSTWFAHSTQRLSDQRWTASSRVRQLPDGRDSGDARTFRSPAGCPGYNGKDASADSFVFEELPPPEVRGIKGRVIIFAVPLR
jgi:hypothetical protein